MERDGFGERKPFRIIETILVRLEEDASCVMPICNQQKIIKKGEEAIESPSTPGHYYHVECFRDLIRSTGKDPDIFIKIISQDTPNQN